MKSPEETELSDDLHRMVGRRPFDLDLEAIERSGRRQRRRGLAVRGLAGVAVLGVAVVGSLAAANHSGTTGSVAGQAAARTATGCCKRCSSSRSSSAQQSSCATSRT